MLHMQLRLLHFYFLCDYVHCFNPLIFQAVYTHTHTHTLTHREREREKKKKRVI